MTKDQAIKEISRVRKWKQAHGIHLSDVELVPRNKCEDMIVVTMRSHKEIIKTGQASFNPRITDEVCEHCINRLSHYLDGCHFDLNFTPRES